MNRLQNFSGGEDILYHAVKTCCMETSWTYV